MIGQADHGLNLGATGSIAYMSRSARLRSALPLWDMSDINHVHCFDLWWKFLLSPHIRLARFALVFALRSIPLVFDIELASLLEDPTLSVGMISWFVGGAMNLAGSFEDFI